MSAISWRRRVCVVAAAATAVAVAGAVSPQAVAASSAPSVRAAARAIPPGLREMRQKSVIYTRNGRFGPFGPNPEKALVPRSSKVDWGGWRRLERQTALRAAAARKAAGTRAALQAPTPRDVREGEPAGIRGSNDSFRPAPAVSGFGTSREKYPYYTVLGRLSPAPVPLLEVVPPNTEPDDALEQARDTGIARTRLGIRTTGFIGDNVPDP